MGGGVRGLSPRGRGNPSSDLRAGPSLRSIPAGAGEPSSSSCLPLCDEVYPRGGGGTNRRPVFGTCRLGLSPRGRGNRDVPTEAMHGARSIPAGAGEPEHSLCPASSAAVYPRGGGGTIGTDEELIIDNGLSPRGRGNLTLQTTSGAFTRSIPAGAGEPHHRPRRAARWKVYPRGGGGTVVCVDVKDGGYGLSPRGRGNR